MIDNKNIRLKKVALLEIWNQEANDFQKQH